MSQAAADIGETSIVSRTGGATTFAMGMANFLKSYLGGHDSMAFWYHFAIMFEALFILTTVDNGTRVARYQIGEMLGNVRKLKKFADPTWKPGNIITTLIATGAVGRTAVDGRVRRERRHQRDGAYLRHLQPAARRRLLRADHRVCGQDGLLEAPVDTGGTARVGHRRDLHRRLPEDLRAAELLHHRLQVSGADRLRRADPARR